MDEAKARKILNKIHKILEMIEEGINDPLTPALAEMLLGNAAELRDTVQAK